jgi:hypothetical protein
VVEYMAGMCKALASCLAPEERRGEGRGEKERRRKEEKTKLCSKAVYSDISLKLDL